MYTGCTQFTVQDKDGGYEFPVIVMYPCSTPSIPSPLGPFTMDLSIDAPFEHGPFPLVIVSHGGGGSHLVYRSLCGFLAQKGFVVAMLEHPGNNRRDNALEGSYENLQNRPRHISLTIDTLYEEPFLRQHLFRDQVAIIGHSMGGYTALALAGGIPWTQNRQIVDVNPDPRIRAMVLFAPAAAFFIPEGSLDRVNIPVLLYAAEHDTVTPHWQAELLLDSLPNRSQITYHLIENAGHLSFLCPYPPEMVKPGFFPAMDPEGFDREAFQERLKEEVTQFLARIIR